MSRREWLLCLATVSLTSCSPTAGLSEFPVQTSAVYPLDAGDELKVSAYGLEGLADAYVIGPDGTISLPLIGPVMAGGKTPDQVRQEITEQLTAKQILNNPFVNVQVSKYRPFFVIGEVQRPGEYPFRPGMTVLNAISMAGGYTFRANTSKVSIIRRRGGTTATGAASDQALIQPGDTIRVFESWF